MRKQAIQLLMAFAAVCALGSGLKAQSYAVEFHAPFAFQAANQVMQPGDYIVSRTIASDVQRIRAVNHGSALALRAGGMELTSTGEARAVFHRYGNSLYLSQVWTGSGSGFGLKPSKQERSDQESASVKPETVTILAELR